MATCFVIQGFGKKTDYTDGRVLDLNASYEVIKEAVESAGLTCIRADEIQHSGTIDLPMYQQLLHADLVIADLSTYNINAAFELGVRYGLRPRATLIVAEEGFKNPFDVSHIAIRRYKHLGEDIGVKEAKRFRDDLRQAIQEILAKGEDDSPVYTFLPDLQPPVETMQVSPAAPAPSAPSVGGSPQVMGAAWKLDLNMYRVGMTGPTLAPPSPLSAKDAVSAALEKIKASDFQGACELLESVHKERPHDVFVIQQLALATYKSRQPSPEAALNRAKEIMQKLSPASTNDPETLGLWGAIHKRLWDLNHDAVDLNESIAGYERGFYLKQDYYNGINLAYLLDLRALRALKAGNRNEGITDAVLARRMRGEVVRYAQPHLLDELPADRRYWILATLWEASAGLGDQAAADGWEAQATALDVPSWMLDTSRNQIQAVRANIAEIAALTGGA